MMVTNRVMTFAASIIIAFTVPVLAEDKQQHGDGHAHSSEEGHAEETQHYEKPAFSNVKAAWAFMVLKIGEAEKSIGEKKLEPVHEIGEQMEGAVHTLEDKSDMILADAKPKLASVLKQLDKAVDDMHHGAEKADQAIVELSLKKIKGLMPLIEGLYPAGTLK